ncbi:hypothetical protein D3C76_924120 [compost metagenome]
MRHLRYRRPGHRRFQVRGDHAASRFAEAQAVAGAGLRRQGEVVVAAGVAREQLPAPRVVVGEAAGGEHHGLRPDAHVAMRRADQRAADGAVLDQQPSGRRRFQQAHAKVFRRFRQTRHQRHAVDQMHGAAVAGEVIEMAAEAPAHMQEGARRAGHVEEGGEIGARHDRHAHERGLAHGPAQARQQRADFAGVVGRGDHLVPAAGGAGRVAMHVGNAVAVGELQRGVLLEEGDHVRAGLEEGVDARGVVVLAQLVAQVGARLLDVFLDTRTFRQRIARHPGPAAGPGGGAAEHRVLLHQHDLLAVPGGSDGGRQPGGAGADDQYIAFGLMGVGGHSGVS